MSMRVKALVIAVVMGAAVISGIVEALSSPRAAWKKKGEGNGVGKASSSDVPP